MHSGAPFSKKGSSELSLPSMDIPIDVMQWEVYLPEQYKVRDFAGDVIAADRVPSTQIVNGQLAPVASPISSVAGGVLGSFFHQRKIAAPAPPGQMLGMVLDPSGAPIPGATVKVNNPEFDTTTTTDENGQWLVLNAPSGRYRITVTKQGFSTMNSNVNFDSTQPFSLDTNVSETVTVDAQSVQQMATNGRNYTELSALKAGVAQPTSSVSANVVNLQRRVAGVLPVAIEVPRSGTSFKFVRPLVLNEETKVTFNYKNR
jgi:hypothetical protein